MSDEILHLSDVTEGLEVWFPAELSPHGARLMAALGVTVHIDPFEIPRGGS